MPKCWFAHDDEEIGRLIHVRFPFHPSGYSYYPARCRRCGRVALVEPRGSYSITHYPADETTWEKAMARAHQLAEGKEAQDAISS